MFFLLELLINMFAKSANNFAEFVAHGSNLLDAAIVAASLISLLGILLGGSFPSLKMLRLIRIARIVRLFRRAKELNKIITAISAAVVPVCNSFLILLLSASIYAAIGLLASISSLPSPRFHLLASPCPFPRMFHQCCVACQHETSQPFCRALAYTIAYRPCAGHRVCRRWEARKEKGD